MIRSILTAWTCIFWGLWLGGLGALFLIATRLFLVDRELAIGAAPIIFLVFEKYQILLACAVLISTAGLRIVSQSKRVNALFWILAAAAVGAAIQPIAITPPMEQLRLSGRTDSPEFRKLHGESMAVYSGETLVLLLGGFILPWAIRRPADSQN